MGNSWQRTSLPGVRAHISLTPSIPTSRSAGITRSYVGNSLGATIENGDRGASESHVPIDSLDNLSPLFKSASKFLLAPLLAVLQHASSNQGFYMPRRLRSPSSFSAKTTACARATKTDLSAFPMRSLPSKLRMMYFASDPWQAASNLVIMETFLDCDCSGGSTRGINDQRLAFRMGRRTE
jgi:hypothetical protein